MELTRHCSFWLSIAFLHYSMGMNGVQSCSIVLEHNVEDISHFCPNERTWRQGGDTSRHRVAHQYNGQEWTSPPLKPLLKQYLLTHEFARKQQHTDERMMSIVGTI